MRQRTVWLILLLTLLGLWAGWWLLTSESSPVFRYGITGRGIYASYAPPRVAYVKGEVERLPKGSDTWVPVAAGDELAMDDRIRTRLNGQVLLEFSNDADLFLGSATEIEFSVPLYVWNGDISYRRFGPAAIPTAIRTSDGVLSLNEFTTDATDEIHVNRSLRGTRVAMDGGNAQWITREASTAVPSGSYLRFGGVDALTEPPMIRNPESGEHFSRGFLFHGFNTVWTEAPAGSTYRLEIDRIDDGAPYREWIDSETNAHRFRRLDAGQYVMRVLALDDQGTRTQWSEPVTISIGGRFFGSITPPAQGQEPVRFDVAEYRDNLLLGGFLREDLVGSHEIIFYALTDEWWLQPRSDDFRIQTDPDGYFEVFSRDARSVYLMVVRTGEGDFPERAARNREFPFPDGQHILYHIEKYLR